MFVFKSLLFTALGNLGAEDQAEKFVNTWQDLFLLLKEVLK